MPSFDVVSEVDLLSLSVIGCYGCGDLEGGLDGYHDNDILDFRSFKSAYETANQGSGYFQMERRLQNPPRSSRYLLVS